MTTFPFKYSQQNNKKALAMRAFSYIAYCCFALVSRIKASRRAKTVFFSSSGSCFFVTKGNATPNTSILSSVLSKIPFKPFTKQQFTHYFKAADGRLISKGTTNVGRYLGRWGSKILGPLGAVMTMYDVINTSNTNFQNATPEQQQYLINPYYYMTTDMWKKQSTKEQENNENE